MQIYKILTNTSAIIAAATVAYEAHTMGTRKSAENVKLGGAKDTIRDTIGTSKLNYPSPIYNETKKGIFKIKTPNPFKDIIHGTGGYLDGFMEGLTRNIPTLGFAALTLAAKTKMKDVVVNGVTKQKVNHASLKTVGVVGLGLSVLWNFLKYGTSIFERKDYLD